MTETTPVLDELALLTPEDTATRLGGINLTTLKRKAGNGTWPSTKINGQLRFSADNIRWIIAAHERPPKQHVVHTRAKRRTTT